MKQLIFKLQRVLYTFPQNKEPLHTNRWNVIVHFYLPSASFFRMIYLPSRHDDLNTYIFKTKRGINKQKKDF